MKKNNNKKSILFINYTQYGGGDTVALFRIVSYLSANNYKIGIASPNNTWLNNQLRKTKILLYDVDIPKIEKFSSIKGYFKYFYRLFRAVYKIVNFTKKDSWDIVHVNTLPNIAGVIAGKLSGTPIVWHVHEIMFQSRIGFYFLRPLPKLFADLIVCPSMAVFKTFESNKTHIVSNVIPHDWNTVDEDVILNLKKTHKIPDDEKILLWVGGVEPRKGLQNILKSIEGIDESTNKFIFVVVCAVTSKYESFYSDIITFAKKISRRIIFIENVVDTRPFYAMANVVAQTSLMPEAFGLTVLESMAMGKPVICSGGGGTKEFVENNKTAVIVDPTNIEKLKDAIIWLFSKETFAKEIGLSAKKKSTSFFDTNVLPDLENIYKKL